jgi:hypothetical protein
VMFVKGSFSQSPIPITRCTVVATSF